MLSAVLILIFAFFVVFFVPNYSPEPDDEEEEEIRKTPQMKKLWSLAQTAMKERKPLKAEKALLTILKFDEKNAAAYNRLGILYAKEKHYKEAIECFEIAQSLDNNASSLHNVGLIYFETGKYEKAAMAFSQAIDLEGDQPGRYIAYAKALEKLGERNKAIDALETAYSLNPSTVVLRHLLEIYENIEDFENVEITRHRIEELQIERAKLEEKAKRKTMGLIPHRTKEEKAANKAAKTAAKAEKKAASAAKKAEKAQKSAVVRAPKMSPKAPLTATTARPVKKIAKKRKII
jgi:Putative Zn-dependent protease, contains TPR repeats